MKKITITAHLEVFENQSKLPDVIQTLLNKAHTAREHAYAPYSHFRVGAALLLETGKIITGNNQENASYPSGLCAERVAVYYAGANHPNVTIKALAITARSLNKKKTQPVPPCGACRQALVEYEVNQKSPIEVYFMGDSGTIFKANSVKDLLPLVFDSSFLK
ncbi:MAG: cytidine deaminase [Flavobacteriales bacterium]